MIKIGRLHFHDLIVWDYFDTKRQTMLISGGITLYELTHLILLRLQLPSIVVNAERVETLVEHCENNEKYSLTMAKCPLCPQTL